MADLAQCMIADSNCDEQDVESPDNKNLHLRWGAASGTCKSASAITFNNCNECCSQACTSYGWTWFSFKICNAATAPTSVRPTTSPSPPAYAAPLTCVLSGPVEESCEECCHDCTQKTETTQSCGWVYNQDTKTMTEECEDSVINTNIVCHEPDIVEYGPVSTCDKCYMYSDCVSGTTVDGVEVHNCKEQSDQTGKRPPPSSMFVMPPVLTVEK